MVAFHSRSPEHEFISGIANLLFIDWFLYEGNMTLNMLKDTRLFKANIRANIQCICNGLKLEEF